MNKKYAIAVALFSLKKKKQYIFPLIKERGDLKMINNLSLITDPMYSKSIDFE